MPIIYTDNDNFRTVAIVFGVLGPLLSICAIIRIYRKKQKERQKQLIPDVELANHSQAAAIIPELGTNATNAKPGVTEQETMIGTGGSELDGNNTRIGPNVQHGAPVSNSPPAYTQPQAPVQTQPQPQHERESRGHSFWHGHSNHHAHHAHHAHHSHAHAHIHHHSH